ncbi:DUF4163 domain-containing protein, partial [Candidatus Uhrbacteria bacterium]|nr:DUF4163 domain-containing protein [Candidatus Uhrbacteria bacterium]
MFMFKSYLFVFLALILAVFGFGAGCEQRSVDTESLSGLGALVGTDGNELTIMRTTSSQVMTYTTSSIETEEKGFSYEVSYPVFSGGGEDAVEMVNNNIADYAEEQVALFVEDYENMNHEYDPGPWFLTIDYKIYRMDDFFVSVLMQGSIYSGGAHPNVFFKSFLFNLEEDGRLMRLDDLFNPMARRINPRTGSRQDYLQYISSEAIGELMRRDIGEEGWIMDGAGSEEDNYDMFYLTDDELVFIFGAYQV